MSSSSSKRPRSEASAVADVDAGPPHGTPQMVSQNTGQANNRLVVATDLFLTPSTLQLLLTFVVADDRCPCGSRGLHQAELLELLEGWPERMAWR